MIVKFFNYHGEKRFKMGAKKTTTTADELNAIVLQKREREKIKLEKKWSDKNNEILRVLRKISSKDNLIKFAKKGYTSHSTSFRSPEGFVLSNSLRDFQNELDGVAVKYEGYSKGDSGDRGYVLGEGAGALIGLSLLLVLVPPIGIPVFISRYLYWRHKNVKLRQYIRVRFSW